MMINPSKERGKLLDIYYDELSPWLYFDMETESKKVKDDAPQEIKEKFLIVSKKLGYIKW